MFGQFLRARRASIAVYAGILLPSLAGMAGLGGEYAMGLMSQSNNQRVADAAAYGGAQVYNATASTPALNAAVARVATLNGLASTAAVATMVASPTGSGNQAVQVTVSTTQTLLFSRMISSTATLTIKATAYAELSSSTPACLLAFSSGGSGVTLSGGTHLNAPGCAVASNNTVAVPCGTYMVTPQVKYNSSAAPTIGCTGITAPTGKTLSISKASTADWLAGNASVAQASTNYTAVAAMAAPAAPSAGTSTTDLYFDYTANSTTKTALVALGCTATFNQPTWTVACPTAKTYNFRNMDQQGGISVTWTGAATSVYNFSGYLKNNAATLIMPSGTYNVAGGIYTTGGSTTTFGTGTYNVGRYTTTCSNSDTYSICHNGSSLTFTGPVNMTLTSGIYSGTTTVTIGNTSSANSYNFGGSPTNARAIDVSGAGKLTLGNATATGGVFNVVGKIVTAGGSCLTLPATAAHNIKGSISTAGGLTMGAGVYTIDGYFAMGENGGGAVSCNNTNIGLSANAVSLQIAGSSTGTGSCAGKVFCAAGGYSNITLVAPYATGSTNAGFAIIGPTNSSRTGGALFTAGASGVIVSGVFYMPNGPLNLSGGASLGDATLSDGTTKACLELVATQITVDAGTALASTCTGLGGGGTNMVMLVK